MSIPVPEFVRIEYWSAARADWWVGHAGINLLNPQKYIDGVNSKGKMVARAVIVDTGEVIYSDGGDLL